MYFSFSSRLVRHLCVVIVALLILSSCMNPVSPNVGKKGKIVITINQTLSTVKSLLPGLDMTPASYVISGQGPQNATFSTTINGNSTTISDLIMGNWSITVEAYNGDPTPTLIGTGGATTTVAAGAIGNVSITVVPISGYGTLSLSLTWPDNVLTTPVIEAQLTSTQGGTPQTLNFIISGNSASYTSSVIPTGYYTLSVTLKNGSIFLAGKTDIVRIINGQVTSGTYDFTNAVNDGTGRLSTTITPALADPFEVSIAGGRTTMLTGTTLNLTATVTNKNQSEELHYAWYVNGVDQGVNTSTWNGGSNWTRGYYQIDLTVISSDGKRAGSASVGVDVKNSNGTNVSLSVTGALIDDGSVSSVTVTAEDANGAPLGSATLTKGVSSWTGTMSFTVSTPTQVIFRARGWSDVNGTGNLLHYGENKLLANPTDDSLSVSIGTVLQLLTWTEQTNAMIDNWESIASSSDGAKLAAGAWGGYIWTSLNSGVTWSERKTDQYDGGHAWKSIASSADGTNLVAGDRYGYVYTSTDSGATWTQRMGYSTHSWESVAISSDGTKLAAVDYGGSIYTSSNSGVNWTVQTNAGDRLWSSIASSADGTKLAAVVGGGYIYTSLNSGGWWWERENSGIRHWSSIASSSDGIKLAAGDYNGYIYTSTDSAVTWSPQTNAGIRNWESIASSSDGTKLAAVVQYGYIYTSPDSGKTWTEQTNAGSRTWMSIASSSDGTKLAAVVYNGYIYTASF